MSSSSRLSRLLLLPLTKSTSSLSLLSGSRRTLSTTPFASLPSRAADHRTLIPGPMDPKLKHVPIIEWKGAEHAEANPDNIPPEGDQDHGRSGWGFQSRSRHEHFTFPGEPEYEYYPDRGWIEWVTPTRRKFFYFCILSYIAWKTLPPRHELVVRRDNDWGFMRTDSIRRQGPDDHRPLLIRIVEFYLTDSHDWRIHEWDVLEAELAKTARNRAYFATMGMDPISRKVDPMWSEPPPLINYYPGDIITGPATARTAQQDAEDLGLDLEFFKAQPPHLY